MPIDAVGDNCHLGDERVDGKFDAGRSDSAVGECVDYLVVPHDMCFVNLKPAISALMNRPVRHRFRPFEQHA